MKCVLINKFAVLLLISLFSASFLGAESLKLSEKSLNFGEMALKDKAIVDVIAVNTSKVPLVIKDAEIACTCTKMSYSKRPIMPNDSVLLKITFDAKDKGVFYKKITLFHTGEEKVSEITLRGVVRDR